MRSQLNLRPAAARAREKIRIHCNKVIPVIDGIENIGKVTSASTIRKSKKRIQQDKKKELMRMRRKDATYRKAENERNKEAIKIFRSSGEFGIKEGIISKMAPAVVEARTVEKETTITTIGKSKKRMQQDKAKELMRMRRKDATYRKAENERKKNLRSSNEHIIAERILDGVSQQVSRNNSHKREVEKHSDTLQRRATRLNTEKKATERSKNTAARQTARKNPTRKLKEQSVQTLNRRITRANPVTKSIEQAQNTLRRRIIRSNPDVKLRERTHSLLRSTLKTKSNKKRKADNELESSTKREKKIVEEIGKKEKAETIARKKRARSSLICRQRENTRRSILKAQKETLSLEARLDMFVSAVKAGPTYVCSCCGGLWFRKSVISASIEKLMQKYDQEFISKALFIIVESPWHCRTCYLSINSGKIPRLCLCNGLDFQKIPEVLKNLTALEERLVALRLPFLQIRTLGIDRQCGLKGNVVHIPNDLDSSVAIIPRSEDESKIIPVILVRDMAHEKPYIFQNISPARVYEAAKYLLTTPLYKQEGATLSESWLQNAQGIKAQQSLCMTPSNVPSSQENQSDQCETMLIKYGSEAIKIAPGQGKKPLSLIMDVNAEEASYPTIYGGVKRIITSNVSVHDVWKSETRRYDRRCALPHKVLHAYKLSQNHQVANSISICLRKKKGNQATAAQLLDQVYLSDFINHDSGFRILKDVRTSPAYWESKTKHIFAMIRQLGIPSLFITLSAAESQWPELLVILKKVLDNETVTEDSASALSYEEKADLIRRDPVTCSRYFDFRLRTAFNLLFKPAKGIFQPYKLSDFYWRIEFQHRGSPHVHMLVWLEEVPKLEKNSTEYVSFIDGLISCDSDIEGVIHQQHRHTKSCQRKTKTGISCRFNIPYPPMPSTTVMTPYGKEFPSSKRKKGCETISKIKLYLEDHRKDLPDLSFEEFLDVFRITENEYMDSIRCSIKRPTVFLKRNVKSVFTNACIPTLAKVWRSNMDVQPIVDPFAVARYVASYMTKSTGGISKLMKETADQIKQGNYMLKEKMRKIANQFLNCVEISAPEAAYGILSIPLTKSSRDCVFINTGPPEQRVKFLKSNVELQKLDPNSTDVTTSGTLDHYANRPNILENISLAEFASMYSYSSRNKWNKSEGNEDSFEEDNEEETCPEGKTLKLRNGSGFLRKRRFSKIIRFRRYGEKEEPMEYYRECLMLYLPWRNEQSDIVDINHEEAFRQNMDIIIPMRQKFNVLETETLEALEFEDYDASDAEIDDEFEVFDDFRNQADICNEMIGEQNNDNNVDRVPVPDLLSDTEYEHLIRSLNQKQKMYTCHLLEKMEQNTVVLEFVYGGAGVGKSKLIEAIVQSSVRLLNLKLRKGVADLSTCKVLVGAPTGMAAFNIKGSTLHSLFMLPLNQFRGGLPKLSDDKRNSISCALRDCKLLIIDEVSMVSNDQLYHISTRLQQIFNNSLDFGGISVILFGDLRQLKPVCAATVFSNLKTDFGEAVGNPIWERFESFELDEIMRQKDDKVFAEALNRLSKGCMTDDDVKLFQSREVSKCGLPKTKCVHLYKDNKNVSKYNEESLNLIQEESTISKAIDICQGRGKPEWRKSLLESVVDLSTAEAMGLPGRLHMVLTAKYMITNNLDTSDGLVNGSLGTLRKITFGVNSESIKRPIIAWLQFKEKRVGEKRIKEKRALLKKENVQSWVPIQLEKKAIKTWPGRDLKCIRMQFPMVPAEGMTIHKCQGSTHDEIVLDVNGVSRQALYVGCSRARTLQGLFIIGNFKAPTCLPNDPIEMEMIRVKEREIVFKARTNADEYIFGLTSSSKPCAKKDDIPLQSIVKTSILINHEPEQRIIHIGAVSIHSCDLQTLDPMEWLSDAVVDGFLELLMQTPSPKSLHNFGSFFCSHLQNNDVKEVICRNYAAELSRDLLSFPVCIGYHWRVVIAVNSTKSIRCWNSLRRDKHDKAAENIISLFLNGVQSKLEINATPWHIDECRSPAPQQHNSYDCGLFVCKFVEMASKGEQVDFSQDDLNEYRDYIRDCITNQRISI